MENTEKNGLLFAGVPIVTNRYLPPCPQCEGTATFLLEGPVDGAGGCMDCGHTWGLERREVDRSLVLERLERFVEALKGEVGG